MSSVINWHYLFIVGTHKFNLHVPFYIGNVFHGLFFYAIGFYLKSRQFNTTIFLLSIIGVVLNVVYPSKIDFRANDLCSGHYLVAIVYELSGCIFINNVFHRFLDRKIPLLTHIGCMSMIYYLVHYPTMEIVSMFLPILFKIEDGTIKFISYSLLLIVALYMFEKLFQRKSWRFIVGA